LTYFLLRRAKSYKPNAFRKYPEPHTREKNLQVFINQKPTMRLLLLLTALGSQLPIVVANGPVVAYNEHLSTMDEEVICASEVRIWICTTHWCASLLFHSILTTLESCVNSVFLRFLWTAPTKTKRASNAPAFLRRLRPLSLDYWRRTVRP
jgi:hypothetical protein